MKCKLATIEFDINDGVITCSDKKQEAVLNDLSRIIQDVMLKGYHPSRDVAIAEALGAKVIGQLPKAEAGKVY